MKELRLCNLERLKYLFWDSATLHFKSVLCIFADVNFSKQILPFSYSKCILHNKYQSLFLEVWKIQLVPEVRLSSEGFAVKSGQKPPQVQK